MNNQTYSPIAGLPWAVIVDIDGTVAKHPQRGHYDYDDVINDIVNEPVADLVRLIAKRDTILYVSGREDRCRVDTDRWLARYRLTGNMLYMRKTGDHRSDDIVKSEIFEEEIRPFYNIRFVLDDRDRVVEMWRRKGLACLQVDRGNF